ncbi:MAG: hypothetical protein JWP10_1413 [Nocardioidaceae bacterium]|nr:hypothetical protein [Nocardioidaceae bacterium]
MKTPTRILLMLVMTASTVVLGAASAFADEPANWEGGEDQSKLTLLLIFVGGPIALGLFLTIFALVTSRRNYVPPPAPTQEIATTSGHH